MKGTLTGRKNGTTSEGKEATQNQGGGGDIHRLPTCAHFQFNLIYIPTSSSPFASS